MITKEELEQYKELYDKIKQAAVKHFLDQFDKDAVYLDRDVFCVEIFAGEYAYPTCLDELLEE